MGRGRPWNFATPQVTEERLLSAGFAGARCWLEPRPVTPEEPAAYLTTIVLGAHLERLPPELHERFVARPGPPARSADDRLRAREHRRPRMRQLAHP